MHVLGHILRARERAARRGPWSKHETKVKKRFQAIGERSSDPVMTLEDGDFMGLQGTGDVLISR